MEVLFIANLSFDLWMFLFLDCTRGVLADIQFCCQPHSKCKPNEGHCGELGDDSCESNKCGTHADCKSTITDATVECCK